MKKVLFPISLTFVFIAGSVLCWFIKPQRAESIALKGCEITAATIENELQKTRYEKTVLEEELYKTHYKLETITIFTKAVCEQEKETCEKVLKETLESMEQ